MRIGNFFNSVVNNTISVFIPRKAIEKKVNHIAKEEFSKEDWDNMSPEAIVKKQDELANRIVHIAKKETIAMNPAIFRFLWEIAKGVIVNLVYDLAKKGINKPKKPDKPDPEERRV